MKNTWRKPTLEVLDVSKTMKGPGHGGEDDPSEPGPDEFGS